MGNLNDGCELAKLKENMRCAILEELEGLGNSDLGMVFRDGLETDHEIADGMIPVYTQELIDLAAENTWLLTEEPELECKTGLQSIQFNLYEEFLKVSWTTIEEFKEDDEDEKQRFENFLTNHEGDFEDCEEAYHAFDSARTSESDVYEEVWEDKYPA
ncbi:MAG: hypothetical protein JRC86_00510 [Deltaproteobacteria bacterium]|nr:hypothetical protein [Deltaproteobacteria bacterium]